MKNKIIKLLKIIGLYKTYVPPKNVVQNYIELDDAKYSILNNIITDFCLPEKYASTENRLIDINALLLQRLTNFRESHNKPLSILSL